jgi:hypothetical protein
MSSSKQVAAAVIILDECGVFGRKRKNRKRKEMWAKKWLLGRDRFTHLNFLNFIRNDSPEDCKNYLRMLDENVQYLIAKLKPLIAKQATVIRNAITPEGASRAPPKAPHTDEFDSLEPEPSRTRTCMGILWFLSVRFVVLVV